MEQSRAATPVIGNILLVGLAIVLIAVLAVVSFSILDDSEPAPRADFEAEYQNGTLTIVHTGGDEIAAANLRVHIGDTVVDANWSNQTVSAGDRFVTSTAALGDPVRVSWVKPAADRSSTLFVYEIPGQFFQATSWDGGSGSVSSFQSQFSGTSENTTWLDRSGYVAWQQSQNPSEAYTEYRYDLPDDARQVDVTIEFTTSSYEASGVHVYTLASDGDVHTLWCDGSSNFHGGTDQNIDACSDLGNSYTWSGTKSAADASGIEAVYFVSDPQENTNNGDPEELSQFDINAGTAG